MRKLNNRKLKWIVKEMEKGAMTTKEIAEQQGITRRRVQQIHKFYKTKGYAPFMEKPGKRSGLITEEEEEIVLDAYKKYLCNAVYLEKLIYCDKKIRIPHNRIHKILKKNGFSKDEPKKKRQRKYCRYERKHSLSLGHIDFHESRVPGLDGTIVVTILDDASRKILSGMECSNATTDMAVKTYRAAQEWSADYGGLLQLISDRGSQFCNNRNTKNMKHEFTKNLEESGTEHILCKKRHPQTNGKEEKWFDCYEKHRGRFGSFQEFIDWYNNRPHGSLNLRHGWTPNEAFVRKMRPEVWLGFTSGLGWW